VSTEPSVAHEFEEVLPNAELNFIPRCGHAPMVERPHEFNNIVEQFFNRIFGHSLRPEPVQSQLIPTSVQGAGSSWMGKTPYSVRSGPRHIFGA